MKKVTNPFQVFSPINRGPLQQKGVADINLFLYLTLLMKTESEEIVSKIGLKVIQIRKEKGIKQIDLATYTNIDERVIRRIETGKTNPTIKTLIKIALGLGVSVKDLLDFD